MKKYARLLALLLAAAMLFALAGCGKGNDTPSNDDENNQGGGDEAKPTTLVVGYDYFSEKFSKFFSKTQYDQDVASMTSVSLLGTDREGNVILNGIEGEDVAYNGTTYHYDGIADCVITTNDDGTVTYDFTMRDDIVFSDGEPMTADDVIFSMYVYCDPTYDGSTTFGSLPIVGLEAYKGGMDTVRNLIAKAGHDGQSEFVSAEDTAAFWAAVDAAGPKFAQSIVDYCINAGYGTDVATAAPNWGYDGVTTVEEFWDAIVKNVGVKEDGSWDFSDDGINKENAGTSIVDMIDAELGDNAAKYNAGVATGESAPNVTGIEKTGDYSVRVTLSKFAANAIYQLPVDVSPLHYYGDKAQYDYENNKFGFPKGDLSLVKSKTTQPLGAGPYVFDSYKNGVVTFHANEKYFKGCPKTDYILFQETPATDKLSGLVAGSFDITDPSFSKKVAADIAGYNSNKEITGNVITTNLVDNLGYGYMGICANTVNVGGEPASEASKDLRKGFATLLAVYRDTAINSYYGEAASVIQYPISNTSWAAPRPADEGYQIAFSVDVDGNPIYTDGMTEEEKYAAALDAAIGYFKAAGYTWDEAAGKFTAAPAGAKLDYTAMIPADGTGDHPAFGIYTATKEALASIGINFQINDLSDSNVLWNALESGECEMWTAAWSATVDPDMYQVYHSDNIVGKGGTDSNHYAVADAQLDELILEARTSPDQAFRKATYKQCLDILMDWAVEVPNYQRQNCIIFSTERVNMDTVTPDITTFWGWMNDIELLEVNAK